MGSEMCIRDRLCIDNLMLMLAHDLAQTAPHPVAHDCAAESPRCNEADAPSAIFFSRENAENQQGAALFAAVLFHTFEFRRTGQPPRFRK